KFYHMNHHFSLTGIGTLTLILAFFTPLSMDHGVLIGFTPQQSKEQLQLEELFDTHLSSDRIRDRIKWMSDQPNHLGSPKQYENARYLDSLFRSWGFESEIEEFQVLLPTPAERVLELVEPVSFQANLSEPPFEADQTSSIREGSLPPYNAF